MGCGRQRMREKERKWRRKMFFSFPNKSALRKVLTVPPLPPTCLNSCPHQSWKASRKSRAESRKPKNFRCKKLKAESLKKVSMMKAESQKLYFSSAFGFFLFFLFLMKKKAGSLKDSQKPRAKAES